MAQMCPLTSPHRPPTMAGTHVERPSGALSTCSGQLVPPRQPHIAPTCPTVPRSRPSRGVVESPQAHTPEQRPLSKDRASPVPRAGRDLPRPPPGPRQEHTGPALRVTERLSSLTATPFCYLKTSPSSLLPSSILRKSHIWCVTNNLSNRH